MSGVIAAKEETSMLATCGGHEEKEGVIREETKAESVATKVASVATWASSKVTIVRSVATRPGSSYGKESEVK